jgi:nucleolar pre-ribosomal-associated protein 1
MWSFGDSNNQENLLVAVPSVLALFLKTISTQLEFRDFGIALCKHLLLKEQLRLFNRNLIFAKAKEHIISPCIRLLTEIVSFDGGNVARLVHSKREITFKRLDIFLTPSKVQSEDDLLESKKSTLRRNAQRFVLANLRFQSGAAKSDFIEQHKIIRPFLEYIRRDSREIVVDVIRAIDQDIAHDSGLPRSSKTKFFNRWNLERLVTLYGYDRDSDERESEALSITQEIHKLLMQICTVPEMGVLLPQAGWYPTGSDPDALITEDDVSIELGLDSPIYQDKYRDSVPVRNGILSSLIQALRPESDTLQTELLLAIFKAAPELVADFFTKRTMFTSDPRPTTSWLGESAFLFSTVQLPVPVNCGWKEKVPAMPPPISIVIENVLPRPLTAKVLARCLNQNTDDVVTLFAVRILTIAFRKLQAVLKIFNADHGIGQTFWNQASSKLIAEFCRRCPSMKDAVLAFKRTSKEDLQQRNAVMELLSMFYEVVPSIAFEENFDATLIMVEIVNQVEKLDLSDDSELLLSQLQHVLNIAQHSASMRWWQQPGE